MKYINELFLSYCSFLETNGLLTSISSMLNNFFIFVKFRFFLFFLSLKLRLFLFVLIFSDEKK